TTRGNRTASFRTYEQGVAAWWELMRRYHEMGLTTVGSIITDKHGYGGGQDYEEYLRTVVKLSGLRRSTVIDLQDDTQLLLFAKAMFSVEAGRAAWLDAGITDSTLIEGFRLGRIHAGYPTPSSLKGPSGLFGLIIRVLRLFTRK